LISASFQQGTSCYNEEYTIDVTKTEDLTEHEHITVTI
jgi:hypothetical protein